MPEGHTSRRKAARYRESFGGRHVSSDSPQGRFAAGAREVSGRRLERALPHGKHLWYDFGGDVFVHAHLGLYGKFRTGSGKPPEP